MTSKGLVFVELKLPVWLKKPLHCIHDSELSHAEYHSSRESGLFKTAFCMVEVMLAFERKR